LKANKYQGDPIEATHPGQKDRAFGIGVGPRNKIVFS